MFPESKNIHSQSGTDVLQYDCKMYCYGNAKQISFKGFLL